MPSLVLGALVLASGATTIIDNAFVRVTRGGALCPEAATPGCAERVLVALGPATVTVAGEDKKLDRGDVLVVEPDVSYEPFETDALVEVAFRPTLPPVPAPAERIAPAKNTLVYDGPRFFVFEETLAPGDVRPRHSHAARVVIVLNRTRLQQWPDGAPELFKDQVPDTIKWNPPVVHVVKTVGDAPLRNVVIELKPGAERALPTSSSPRALE